MRIKKKCLEIRINEKWSVQRDKETQSRHFSKDLGMTLVAMCVYTKRKPKTRMGKRLDSRLH